LVKFLKHKKKLQNFYLNKIHKNKLRPFFIVMCVVAFHCSVKSQTTHLQIKYVDSFNSQNPSLQTKFSSQLACKNYINNLPNQLQLLGFIAASIDSVFEINNNFTIHLFIGKKYNWHNLQFDDDIQKIASITNPNNVNIISLLNNVLDYYANNGYPFAKLYFDSLSINNNTINGIAKVNKGNPYFIDSIRVIGSVNISNYFLQQHINIFSKSLFNQSNINSITERLQQLPFLEIVTPPNIQMLGNGCLITLYLKSKNTNKFDAIFGLLPSNQQTNGALLFTIDAKLTLQNALGSAEKIALNWQQIQPQSPRIDIAISKPFIFKSNFTAWGNFNLYKRDSAWLNIVAGLGISYLVNKRSTFKISIANNSTNIIDADTIAIINSKKLPPILDINVSSLQAEYYFSNATGSKGNRTKGFEFLLSVSAGAKSISKNTTITTIKNVGYRFDKIYDSIKTNTFQLKSYLLANKYFKIGKQSVLKSSITAGYLQTETYLKNEQFQIGGFKLLRGFDEENIFCNSYAVAGLEYRYLVGNNSNFYSFIDVASTQNYIINKNYSYFGTGFGLALETKQGILNVCFAVGKRNDLPLNFREAKIHIGFITDF
jgi:Omp85 superfamily domain